MPGIIESLGELSKLAIQRFSGEAQKLASDAIGEGIAEGIQKSREKLFSLAISISLVGSGSFLALWGIATGIDTYFAMRGFGYLLVGLLASVTGALVYKK